MHRFLSARYFLAGLMLCGLAFHAGCGGGRPKTTIVTGKVTLGGRSWPKAGTIYFTPTVASGDGIKRPAMGAFEVDGNYSVSTWEKGDGLLPGKYSVSVECWITPPSMGGPPPKSCVPPKYANVSTSGLFLTVESGESSKVFNFDVPRN